MIIIGKFSPTLHKTHVVGTLYLVIILGPFSPVLDKNICSGYSLEAPRRGASN